MPRFKIIVDNPKVAQEKEIERTVAANLAAYGVDQMQPVEAARLEAAIDQAVRVTVGEEKPEGTVHDTVESDCPKGLPNCRNCGDPAYAASCQAAGHCPECGTKHGLAPDSVVAANGYRLEAE